MPGYLYELVEGAFKDKCLCTYCQMVCRDPMECKECGKFSCDSCAQINSTNKAKVCNDCRSTLIDMNKFIKRIYTDLQVTCKNCKKAFSIERYPDHEKGCGRPPCVNFNICAKLKNETSDFCGDACQLLDILKSRKEYPSVVFDILQDYKEDKYKLFSQYANSN